MIINLKSQTDLSGFYVIYEGSTLLETKGVRGISHLMEHLFCKAYEHLENDFERKGIYSNAYTSNNEVVYYITGLDEQIKDYRKIVVDSLMNFIPSEKQFLHEKKIVIEEYKDYFNMQNYCHYLNLTRKLYNDYDPIGSLQDLESMSYADMVNYIKAYYNAPSKIINVSKNSDFEYNDIVFNKHELKRELIHLENEPEDVVYEINNDFADKVSILAIGPLVTEDYAIVHFITYMLSNGLQSPLYKEIREKRGLSYGVSASIDRVNNKGIISIGVQTSNEKADEVVNTIELVLNNPKEYMTEERFNIVKECFLISNKKRDINRYNSVTEYMCSSEWNVNSVIEKLTLDDVLNVYNKYFNYKDYYISVDKEEFPLVK
jgi:predicted Zn-dependent peptidase